MTGMHHAHWRLESEWTSPIDNSELHSRGDRIGGLDNMTYTM